MRSKKLFLVLAVLLSTFALMYAVAPQVKAIYRGQTLYFNGQTLSNGPGGAYYLNGNYVDFINGSQYTYPESNVYPLGPSFPDDRGSTGYVMPNKQFYQAGTKSNGSPNYYASTVNNGGGALGTNAMSKYAGNDKEKMFAFLKDKNENGTEWEKMGSAHIVHQMLEHTRPWEGAGKSGRKISSTEWTELKNRLVNNPNLTMTRSKYTGANTVGVQYSSTGIDVVNVTRVDTETAWVFKDGGGKVVYALEIICANPMGVLEGLPPYTPTPAIEYSLTPSILDITNKEDDTTISSNGFVNRGADVVIKNRVRNDGPDASAATTRVITRIAYKSDASPSTTAADATSPCSAFSDVGRVDNGALGCSGIKTIPEAILGAESNSDRNTQDEYKIDSRYEVDTKVCFVVSIRKPTQDASNDTWRHSAMRCVVVAREYVLIPTIDGLKFFGNRGDGAVVEPGMSGTIEHSVDNTGKDDAKGVEWRLTYYEYGPKRSSLTATEKAAKKDVDEIRDPCSAFPGGVDRLDCTYDPINGWRDESKIFAPGPTSGPALSYTVPDDKVVGTKMCWVASVRPPTASSPTTVWRHSAMYCIIVGKKPKMQVWGGDVRVGGRINTSTSTVSSLNSTFGSWSEYGALSRGVNVGFSSGAGLAGGGSSAGQAEWSDLTFANVTGGRPAGATCTSRFGCFASLPLVSMSLIGQFPSEARDVDVALSNLDGIYDTDKNITLTGATIGQRKSVIIRTTGTVTISGDITYSDGPYSSLQEIPQVIINAPTINIESNVTNVDAWLLAGVLNTCSKDGNTVINPAATGLELSSNQCNQVLRVNGPVVANKVYLMRTAGSEARDGQRGDPGEIFNLRADAYLWGYGYGSDQSRIQTVHTKELSPRF